MISTLDMRWRLPPSLALSGPESSARTHPEDILPRSAWLRTTLVAGLVAGALDILAAILLYLRVGPLVVLQSVASGLLGGAAYDGGAATALLGLILHLAIALIAAGVYVFTAQRVALLRARAIQCGVLFGLAMFAVMNYLVVPLSRADVTPPTPAGMIQQMLVHVLLFGLPVALIARRMLKR